MTTEHLCHWCNRPVSAKELIFVPDNYLELSGEVAPPRIRDETPVPQHAWHNFCFEIIVGTGE